MSTKLEGIKRDWQSTCLYTYMYFFTILSQPIIIIIICYCFGRETLVGRKIKCCLFFLEAMSMQSGQGHSEGIHSSNTSPRYFFYVLI